MMAHDADELVDALLRRECLAMHGRFEIVGAEHDDDEIERLVRVQQRRQCPRAVAVAIAQMIIERGRPAIQPLGDHLDPAAQRFGEHGRPADFPRMPPGRNRIVPPSQ